MNRPKLAYGVAAGVILGGLTSTCLQAQTAEALMDKLVEKGILTVKEANELKEEVDKNFTQAYAAKSGMPEWVSALKFNGDFRGRFEGFYMENPEYVERNRWRYRLRFGVTASLFENFEVGLRLGSGDMDSYPSSGIDPISNNQTFQNNGSKKGIFLDQAFARWSPLNSPVGTATLTMGKMENPFVLSDMVFDPDYTPEGLGLQTAFNLSEKQNLKFNAGGFVIDEIGGSTEDPYLVAGQLRLDSAWSKKVSTSAGLAGLTITSEERLANTTVPNINVGNTRLANGAPAYDFTPVVGDASVTFTLDKAPLYRGAFPIKVGGEYVYNPGAPDDAGNDGFSVGLTLGKAGKKRTWEVAYTYKYLGANAWWEELTDSDFGAYWKSPSANAGAGKTAADYYAGTNVRGHIVRLAYAPYDFLTLSAKWFYTDLISEAGMTQPTADGSTAGHRVQVDAAFKF